jgi:hypothetical protein
MTWTNIFFSQKFKLSIFSVIFVLGCLRLTVLASDEDVYTEKLLEGWGVVICHVAVDGLAIAPFVLDTGASHTILDQDFIKHIKLGAKRTDGTVSDGFTSGMTASFYVPPKIQAGNIKLNPYYVTVLDLNFIKRHLGINICGVLGMDALRDLTVELDFESEKLLLHRRHETLSQYPSSLYIRKGANRRDRILDAKIGEELLHLKIDTAFTGAIDVKANLFEQLVNDGFIQAKGEMSFTHGFSGLQKKKNAGEFLQGILLGKEIKGVKVAAILNDGLLGISFLRHFRLAFDFPNSRMHYEVRKSYAGFLNVQHCMGGKLRYEQGAAIVDSLDRTGGPLTDVGLSPGDLITVFGDFDGSAINALTVYQSCKAVVDEKVKICVERSGRIFFRGQLMLRQPVYD